MSDEEAALDQEEQEASETPDEELSEQQKLMAELKEAITVQREQVGALRLKLTVNVPRDTVEKQLGKQFAELKRDAMIPGFRKGHAPLRLVEKRFGSDVGEQLKGQLIGSGYLAAVEKEALKPLGDPLIWVKLKEQRFSEDQKPRGVEVEKLLPLDRAIEHLPMPKDGSFTFACELEVKPEFELPKLDKIPIHRPAITIDNEDIEVELERMRMRRGTFQPIEEGAVERDDLLYVAMKLSVGGELLENEDNFDIAARDIRVKGIPLAGLGDALEGHNVGDEVTFEAIVPDDHENLNLRGKAAKFEFTIREIKRLELPPIDDEFLSSMGIESEQDLRGTLRSLLESELERTVKRKMHDQVGEYLLDHTNLDIPEGLSQRQTDRSVARRMIEMLQSGVPATEIERVRDEMRAKAHDQVIRDLKLFFVLEKIAEEREIDVNEEQLNAAISQIARRSGKRFDRMRDELSKRDGLTTLYLQLRDEKVLDTLVADGEVTEVEGPKRKSTKAAKKKTTAKPVAKKKTTKGKKS
jgi:trigger factor